MTEAEGDRPLRAAVFASGGGSNFQALLDHERRSGEAAAGAGATGRAAGEGSPWSTVLLVTDRASCGALERAQAAGVPTRVIEVAGREAAEIGAETVAALDQAGVEVLFLAGYLRLLPPAVVTCWRRRILNVHPALLPAFGGQGMWGRRVHEAVLASGARITGPTVHFVDEAYDEGSILAQWPVPVFRDDTPERLAARVLQAEHVLYPQVAAYLCRALRLGNEALPPDPAGPHFTSSRAPGVVVPDRSPLLDSNPPAIP